MPMRCTSCAPACAVIQRNGMVKNKCRMTRGCWSCRATVAYGDHFTMHPRRTVEAMGSLAPVPRVRPPRQLLQAFRAQRVMAILFLDDADQAIHTAPPERMPRGHIGELRAVP